VAQDYIDSGVPEECVQQFRHILTKCFGAYDDVRFDFRHAELQAGNALLLCTDGLTNLVSDMEIQDALERSLSPQSVCDELIQRALERGGHDNLTVIMGRFH
jgi:protein phosphatase